MILKTKDITMQFGGVTAVFKLNIDINDGEIVALIGPNGNTLAECEDGKESAAVGDVDIALLNKFRGTFPVLTDADSFHLSSLEQPQTANPLSEKNH